MGDISREVGPPSNDDAVGEGRKVDDRRELVDGRAPPDDGLPMDVQPGGNRLGGALARAVRGAAAVGEGRMTAVEGEGDPENEEPSAEPADQAPTDQARMDQVDEASDQAVEAVKDAGDQAADDGWEAADPDDPDPEPFVGDGLEAPSAEEANELLDEPADDPAGLAAAATEEAPAAVSATVEEPPLAAETHAEAEVEVDVLAPTKAKSAPALPDVPAIEGIDHLSRVLLTLLLAAREGTTLLRLAQSCDVSQKAVVEGLDHLAQLFSEQQLPLELARSGDHARLISVPEVFPYLQRLRGVKKTERLSPAALETLAVIAYRQPVIRAEIEAIRGVKAGPILRTLLDHKLVTVTGRADVPGRPLQYGTTQEFLERFGLSSLKDLPSVKEFKQLS